MKHSRKTINAKLRAANTERGTLQEVFDEIEAFFEELQQLKQDLHEGKFTSPAQKAMRKLIDEILGSKKKEGENGQ